MEVKKSWKRNTLIHLIVQIMLRRRPRGLTRQKQQLRPVRKQLRPRGESLKPELLHGRREHKRKEQLRRGNRIRESLQKSITLYKARAVYLWRLE